MSSKDEDSALLFAGVAAVVVFSIGSWLSATLGIDLKTALSVLFNHFIFIIGLGVALYFVHQANGRFIWLLPISIVCYLMSWSPAADFWSNQQIHNLGFGERMDYTWYATGWIQALIALIILVVGYGLILRSDSNQRYR
jgi:hypothetical protein